MMKLLKVIMIMAVSILPLSTAAQDVSDLVKLADEYNQLETQINELNALIKQEEDKSFTLRSSWYNTCKSYLQKRQFKTEELDSLINQTIPEIDGQELYEELIYAKRCFDGGEEYQYKDIPAPTRNSVVTPVDSTKNKQKKNSKKTDGDKNKKKDKKKSSSNENNDNPIVDNDADRPKQEDPIVTDSDADRNREDKPAAPVVETTPETTPVEATPKKTNPSKGEKKRKIGEIEDIVKDRKNSDGSIN